MSVDFDNIAYKAVSASLREGYAVSSDRATVRAAGYWLNGAMRHGYSLTDWTRMQAGTPVPAYYDSADDAAKAFVELSDS